MSDSINAILNNQLAAALDLFKSVGAKEVYVYGSGLETWKEGNDVFLAVKGVAADNFLKLTGRLLMDQKLSAELCDIDETGNPFVAQGSKGIKIL